MMLVASLVQSAQRATALTPFDETYLRRSKGMSPEGETQGTSNAAVSTAP